MPNFLENAAEGHGWCLEHTFADQLPELFFAPAQPVPVAEPGVVIVNVGLAAELGLAPGGLSAELLTGNALPPGARCLAQAYGGHQFGHFTTLGDGRAILLGEQRTPAGALVDVQLKGAGRTRFSRGGDGRAAVGPMLREYIISEAMHALGIPTTRSLAVATTGEPVYRQQRLPGAVLTRVAASHLRVGTFQWAAANQDREALEMLVNYTIRRHFPHLVSEGTGAENAALGLLDAVMERQASLVAKWMQVGFIHGVMNTDNMAISGETIDYGPCAFLEAYYADKVFSSIDSGGRYAYGNQPTIAQWNLARFAEVLLPLLAEDEDEAVAIGNAAIQRFSDLFKGRWLAAMAGKLGIGNPGAADAVLVQDLLAWMQSAEADFTNTFRSLTLGEVVSDTPDFQAWHARWQARLGPDVDHAAGLMRAHNPAVIPRNHHVERALAAASDDGDLQPLHALLAALADPYDYTTPRGAYTDPAPPEACDYRTYCGT